MRFEGTYGPFCCVAVVDIWRDILELASPLFFNGQFVGFTGLILQNLYGPTMIVLESTW